MKRLQPKNALRAYRKPALAASAVSRLRLVSRPMDPGNTTGYITRMKDVRPIRFHRTSRSAGKDANLVASVVRPAVRPCTGYGISSARRSAGRQAASALDILLIRREAGELSEASRQDLAELLPLLNRFTLIQFKGPTDALQRGDLAQLLGCAFLWHSQQAEAIPQSAISLLVLAPTVNKAVHEELQLLGCQIDEQEAGIFRVAGLHFAAWLVETDVMAERGQPILSLVSRVFLRDRERIIEQLTHTGHAALLYYMLQQVQQFRSLGEDFAMQHKDLKYMGEVEEELQTVVLEAIPAERIVRRVAQDPDDPLQTAVLEAIPAERIVRAATGRPADGRVGGDSGREASARRATGRPSAWIVAGRVAWRAERGTGVATS